MKKNAIKFVLLIAIISSVAAIFRFTSLEVSDFTPERVKEFVLGFGYFAPLVFVLLYGLRGIVVVIPVLVMSLTSGLVFGVFWGWLLNVSGATIGSSLSFLVSRYFGRDFVESLPLLKVDSFKKIDNSAAENGFKVVLFMRLVPLFQYDVVNFGCGLSKISFRDYFLASFIGMLPGGFITNFLGSSLDDLKSPKFIIALSAFVLLMFVPFIYKKIKRSTPRENKEGLL